MTPRKFVAIIAAASLLPFGFVVGSAAASDAASGESSARIVSSRCLYDDDTDTTRTVTKITNRSNRTLTYRYVARERQDGYTKSVSNFPVESLSSRRVRVRHQHAVLIKVVQENTGEIVFSTRVRARDC